MRCAPSLARGRRACTSFGRSGSGVRAEREAAHRRIHAAEVEKYTDEALREADADEVHDMAQFSDWSKDEFAPRMLNPMIGYCLAD